MLYRKITEETNSSEIDIFAHILSPSKEHNHCDASVSPPEYLFTFIWDIEQEKPVAL